MKVARCFASFKPMDGGTCDRAEVTGSLSTRPSVVTVPGNSNDELAPGTLNSILKQAALK